MNVPNQVLSNPGNHKYDIPYRGYKGTRTEGERERARPTHTLGRDRISVSKPRQWFCDQDRGPGAHSRRRRGHVPHHTGASHPREPPLTRGPPKTLPKYTTRTVTSAHTPKAADLVTSPACIKSDLSQLPRTEHTSGTESLCYGTGKTELKAKILGETYHNF